MMINITEALLHKYDVPVPRYTSYPPATSFAPDFASADYLEAVEASNTAQPQNISIYIHIPFCRQRCHFCGCNTVQYPLEDKIAEYVQCVLSEIRMVAPHISPDRRVTQVSWGGGTPNSIRYEYIEAIMSTLREVFTFAEDAEIAIECSPAYLDYPHVDELRRLGFNRISLGIQDFHLDVLKAINRLPSMHPVQELLPYIKASGFSGVNIDLVYGLPLQTLASFGENVEQIIALRPDRLATFSYAHVPWFNANQKLLERYPLPTGADKIKMLTQTVRQMTEAGYNLIGMDHFALPDDDLSRALEVGDLHRNFQGYNTRRTAGQVYAFGASGISQLDGAYAQNVKSSVLYVQLVKSGRLPIERGYKLTDNERMIREAINEIMCNGRLDFAELAERYGLGLEDFYRITQFDSGKLSAQMADGLLTLSPKAIEVNPLGMLVVRPIAAAFDPTYTPASGQYSRTL